MAVITVIGGDIRIILSEGANGVVNEDDVHNLLRAHGSAAKVLKTIKDAEVGYASCGTIFAPATDSKEDFDAAFERTFNYYTYSPLWSTSGYADPIFFGKYPAGWYEFPEDVRPEITDEDMKRISVPIDFFALNIYEGRFVRRARGVKGMCHKKTLRKKDYKIKNKVII